MLVDRTEHLEANALRFSKSSTALKRSMRWRSVRCYLFTAVCALALCWYVLARWCGGLALSECRRLGWPSVGHPADSALDMEAEGYTKVLS